MAYEISGGKIVLLEIALTELGEEMTGKDELVRECGTVSRVKGDVVVTKNGRRLPIWVQPASLIDLIWDPEAPCAHLYEGEEVSFIRIERDRRIYATDIRELHIEKTRHIGPPEKRTNAP